MYFPIINAVDDGVFLYVGLALSTAYYGCEFWTTKYELFGINGTLVYFFIQVLSKALLIQVVIAVKNIYL